MNILLADMSADSGVYKMLKALYNAAFQVYGQFINIAKGPLNSSPSSYSPVVRSRKSGGKR